MNKLANPRAIAVVFGLAALAFTASGVPDNKGTDAAIGWSAFLVLALVFLVLTGTAVVRRLRSGSKELA
jgi:membrane protein implicated in regulation of membrane protease activity